jgi:hypothetical protein
MEGRDIPAIVINGAGNPSEKWTAYFGGGIHARGECIPRRSSRACSPFPLSANDAPPPLSLPPPSLPTVHALLSLNTDVSPPTLSLTNHAHRVDFSEQRDVHCQLHGGELRHRR